MIKTKNTYYRFPEDKIFIELTENLNLEDWRKVRNNLYWETSDDLVDPLEKLKFKIEFISDYLKLKNNNK